MKNTFKVIGLMSGTSLDGLDMAYVSFSRNESIHFELLNAECIPYSKLWKDKLSNAFYLDESSLKELDTEYGNWLGNTVLNFIKTNNLEPDLIASHGHTIFHRPQNGYTLQIGAGKRIHEITQTTLINNFRVQDVELGGQGAPLVPMGDEILFSEYDFCLNLGGFSNISWKQNGIRYACDIGPCNILLNSICKRLQIEYDKDGFLAKKGKSIESLLEKWNQIAFYFLSPPKSLGREWFEQQFKDDIFNKEYIEIDLLATAIQHIAFQLNQFINSCISQFNTRKLKYRVLITGGGANHLFLVQKLRELSNRNLQFEIPDASLVNFKEAIVFALLGYLRWQGENNVLSSVTGSIRDHCSGDIFNG
ncbi:MAG: anhydro-N-acetylmuramic acid kinase [Saprospiraceae bacterium]